MYSLFITRGYPTEKYKTHGIFEFDQALALADQGQKVVYAAIDLRSIRRVRKWGIHKSVIKGIDVYEINIPLGRVPKKILRLYNNLGLNLLYKKIVEDYGKPDILHAHFQEAAFIGSKLKDKTNIPLVVTEHSSQMNKTNIKKDIYDIAKIAYENTDRLIVVSPSLGDMIKKNFDVDSIYIPNIVDLNTFKYSGHKTTSTFNFVSTGNLIDIKRMDLTIEAFYDAFKGEKDIKLDIFGKGPKRKELEEIISKHGIGGQVRLRGMCAREEIASSLREADCFVLASQTETFGVAYIEALAMGVPVIATKCGGPEVFVNEGNGILINKDNKDELIQAMKYMYNNKDKFNSHKIAISTKEKFSSENVARQIMDIYEEVLD